MQSQDHEIEVKQLRETLQEYNSEFAHVKNQEVTIQKLKDQIKDMEDRMEEMTVVSATCLNINSKQCCIVNFVMSPPGQSAGEIG